MRPPEFGHPWFRRYGARRARPMVFMGFWDRQEHVEATSTTGGAREHEAHRPWRRPELGFAVTVTSEWVRRGEQGGRSRSSQ